MSLGFRRPVPTFSWLKHVHAPRMRIRWTMYNRGMSIWRNTPHAHSLRSTLRHLADVPRQSKIPAASSTSMSVSLHNATSLWRRTERCNSEVKLMSQRWMTKRTTRRQKLRNGDYFRALLSLIKLGIAPHALNYLNGIPSIACLIVSIACNTSLRSTVSGNLYNSILYDIASPIGAAMPMSARYSTPCGEAYT